MFSQKSRRTSSAMKMVLLKPMNAVSTTIGNVIPMKYSNNKSTDFMNTQTTSYRGGSGGMSWGRPTWIFLHTIVEKIKSEHFHRFRSELLKNIFMICTNLPCPDCSMHSRIYLNNQNFNAIKTKPQLQTMLYEFHNSVSLRKGLSLFTFADLKARYQNEVLSVTLYNFLIKFKDRGASNRFIHEDIYRSQVSKDLAQWFTKNKEFFDE